MINLDHRLRDCFLAVFPAVDPEGLEAATVDSVAAWDSIATVNLINVIEDEFSVQFDLERLGDYESYTAIRDFVQTKL